VKKNSPSGFELVFSFLFPMIVGKALVATFGGFYSMYPGEGYGYALSFSIAFTLIMAARFIWRYRDHKDE
jgi:hypothetical protein